MLALNGLPKERVLSRSANHMYLLPHAALRPYVAHYTLSFPSTGKVLGSSGSGRELLTLMPDIGGCFVFTLGGHRDVFWGAYTKAVQVEKDFEDVSMRFFIEFHPGGAHRLLGEYMGQFADAAIAPLEVAPELYKRLRHALDTAPNVVALLAAADRLLCAQLANVNVEEPARGMLPLLCSTLADSPVRGLASATGYSERQLGRIFATCFGTGVKSAARVIRINHMLSLLRPGVPLAQIAQEAGYFDQAHMAHDFKAVSGVSPRDYLRSMSDFYKEQFKY